MRLNAEDIAHEYLENLVQAVSRNNHKLVIVISPCRSDYKRLVGHETSSLYKALFGLFEKYKNQANIGLVNAHDNTDFKDNYFGDCDHLLPNGQGTAILTALIRRSVEGTGG